MHDIQALKDRFEERKTDFLNSIDRLQEALDQPVNDFILDSVIKRYETTWETGWKLLKLWLSYKGITALSPRDVWKEAFGISLLKGDADIWSKAQSMRNLTVHTYDQAIAESVHSFIRQDAIDLFQDLKNKVVIWQIEN